jgi:hypothetical protein
VRHSTRDNMPSGPMLYWIPFRKRILENLALNRIGKFRAAHSGQALPGSDSGYASFKPKFRKEGGLNLVSLKLI